VHPSERPRLEALINQTVKLSGRVGGAFPGRKMLTLVHAMVAGATHIDHADILRAGSSAAVLGHRVMAPSTIGPHIGTASLCSSSDRAGARSRETSR